MSKKYSYDEHIEKKISLMSNLEKEKELKKIYLKSKKQSEQIKQLTYKVNNLKCIIRELKGLDEHQDYRYNK